MNGLLVNPAGLLPRHQGSIFHAFQQKAFWYAELGGGGAHKGPVPVGNLLGHSIPLHLVGVGSLYAFCHVHLRLQGPDLASQLGHFDARFFGLEFPYRRGYVVVFWQLSGRPLASSDWHGRLSFSLCFACLRSSIHVHL